MSVMAIYNAWCVEVYIKHEPKIIGQAHTHMNMHLFIILPQMPVDFDAVLKSKPITMFVDYTSL